MVYFILAMCYKFYLEYSKKGVFYPDYLTHLVAHQSKTILNVLGYSAQVLPHPNEPSLKLILNGTYLARVVEGCNGISVIVLFIAFIAAFSARLKTTLLYVLGGSALIYTVNLLRIVALSVGLFHYPKFESILHTVIFPAIIYGMVFVLWIIWVNRFSKLKQPHV